MRIASFVIASVLAFGSIPFASAQEVDQSPLPGVKIVRSFPKLKPRRPVAITHAGDGSNRLFIVSEQGQINVLTNDQNTENMATLLDIEYKTDYEDKENEEGLLGLAFHPKFKQNGEFFINYIIKDPPHTTVISRLRISKDPNKADPQSEEELLRVTHPYWNHKGGNLAFGPDGYLYVSLGDGGSANDPHGHGQKVEELFGSILRLDVDHKEGGNNYASPRDNPFVGKGKARPEIYAYGLRNVWGLSFDRETGLLWAADVGQNIWEEIDIIVNGGNYGWNLREGMHDFDVRNAQPGPGRTQAEANKPDGRKRSEKLIEPIWEYHHDLGKSITGGEVYRGKNVPALVGYYVYADYVTGRVWGLKYDEKSKKVVANRPIESPTMPFMCIGSDEQGELCFGDSFGNLWWPVAADN